MTCWQPLRKTVFLGKSHCRIWRKFRKAIPLTESSRVDRDGIKGSQKLKPSEKRNGVNLIHIRNASRKCS